MEIGSHDLPVGTISEAEHQGPQRGPQNLGPMEVGGKDNPAMDPIIHGLRGVVHH
ncbi:hypothetical protein NHX12_030362, partial [Muraenolepis orangiensis]